MLGHHFWFSFLNTGMTGEELADQQLWLIPQVSPGTYFCTENQDMGKGGKLQAIEQNAGSHYLVVARKIGCGKKN